MKKLAALLLILLLPFASAWADEKEDARLMAEQGIRYSIAGEYEKAFELLLKAAELNDHSAIVMVTSMYDAGDGTEKNETEALKWTLRGAELNIPASLYSLGAVYSGGLHGIAPDIQKAIKYYKHSAELNYSMAQLQLALMYNEGLGVDQDFAEMLKWLHKAADQGLDVACFNLGTAYFLGRGVSRDFVEAEKWHLKAAEQNYADSQQSLAVIYYVGEYGVERDLDKAEKWATKAAANGNAKAPALLEEIRKEKDAVK